MLGDAELVVFQQGVLAIQGSNMEVIECAPLAGVHSTLKPCGSNKSSGSSHNALSGTKSLFRQLLLTRFK